MSNNNKYRFPVISTGNHYKNNTHTTSGHQDKSIETVAKQLSSINIPKAPLDNLDESYNKYGIYPNYLDTQKDYDKARADSQSSLSKIGNSAVQLVGNEVILGMALGLSNLVDFGVNIFAEEGEDDYTNPVSSVLESWQEQIRDRFAIYQEDPNASFAIGDLGWWANNFVSVGSTLSLMLPSMGATSILGKLSRVRGVGKKLSRGLAKASMLKKINGTNDLRGLAARVKNIEEGAKITTQALLSRTMENYQEARGVYNIAKEDALNRLNNFTEEERANFIQLNPEFENKDNNTIANIIAERSANETFINDYAMLLFDMTQFKAISGVKKLGVPNKNTTTTASSRIANRNAAKKLLGVSEDQLEKTGFIANQKEVFRYLFQHPGKSLYNSLAGIEITEGIEEGYQGVQTEKGQEVLESIFNHSFKKRDVVSYLTDPKIYEQAVWGMIGSKVFKWGANKYKKVDDYIKYKKYKDRIKDEGEFNWLLSADEKIKQAEIEDRIRIATEFKNNMQLLESGKNPYAKKIDKDGDIITEEGIDIYETLDPVEDKNKIDIIKANLIDDFITEMTLNAADVGNYDLLKEYLTSNEFNKFFKESGADANISTEALSADMINRMDKVYTLYADYLNKSMDNVKEINNEHIIKAQARDLTRRKIFIEKLEDKLLDLNTQVNKLSNNIAYPEYYRSEDLSNVKKVIEELIKTKTQLDVKFNNNEISKSYYEELKAFLNKRINNLYDKYKIEELNEDDAKASIYERLNFLNEELKTYNPNSIPIPNKAVQDLYKEKIDLELALEREKDHMPETYDEFKKHYREVEDRVDKLADFKLFEAAQTVNKWLDGQEDLDTAKSKIYKEDDTLPEDVKDALFLLKLGSQKSATYKYTIDSYIESLKQKNKLNEEKNRTSSVNNTVNNTNNNVAENKPKNKPKNLKELKQTKKKQTKKEEITPDVPFTGEELEPNNNPIREDDVIPEQVKEKLSQYQAYDSIPNDEESAEYTSLMGRLMFDYIKSLFINTKSILYDTNLNSKNSDAYKQLLEEAKQIFRDQYIPDKYIEKDGERILLDKLTILNNSIRVKVAYKELRERLVNLLIDYSKLNTASVRYSNINEDELNLYNDVINDYFKEFLELNDIPSDAIIDVDNFFDFLIHKRNLSNTELSNIFNYLIAIKSESRKKDSNIKLNVRLLHSNQLDLYKDVPELFFLKVKAIKEQKQRIATNFHMNQDRNSDYINNAKLGDKFIAEYSGNTIVAKLNGKPVAYIVKVQKNKDNTRFKLAIQEKGGFLYEVWQDDDGTIHSNIDDLFNFLIDNNEVFEFLRNEDRKPLNLNINKHNEFKKKLISLLKANGLNIGDNFKFNENAITEEQQINNLIYHINKILFFDKSDISKSDRKFSVYNWVSSVYNNYKHTNNIQELLDKNQKIQLSLSAIPGTLKFHATSKNVSESGLSADNNPIVIVDKDGFIKSESGDIDSYFNKPNFRVGNMGMLIQDNPNAPLIALFTEENKLNDSKIKQYVEKELQDLFYKYQNNEISFNDLYNNLSALISVGKDNLFKGLHIINHEDVIYINIAGSKDKYLAKIYSKTKNKNKSRAIEYFKNGDISKPSKLSNKNHTELISDIINNLVFNKTFYYINKKTTTDIKENPYFGKENGKMFINIGGKKILYNTFGHFVIENNAFKTNTYLQDGETSFISEDINSSNAIFMNVDNGLPVEGLVSTENVVDYIEHLQFGSKEKVTDYALSKIGKTQEFIDNIMGRTEEYPINLLPESFEYDPKLDANSAYDIDEDKIYIGAKGLSNISKNGEFLIKHLMHEQLHRQFAKTKLKNRNDVIKGLLETYNEFIEYINNDNSEEANELRNWVESRHFSLNDYFEHYYPNNKYTQAEKELIFAEEWLVESLTKNDLTNYLNNAILKNKTVIVDNIKDENKSIWQKIIDLILKLFNISSKNIKNNTILAEQYKLLSDEIKSTPLEQTETSSTNVEQTETKEEQTNNISLLNNKRDKPKRQRRFSSLNEIDDYTTEMKNIKEKAIREGNFMKAPNGKDTNLDERQWLQVRTKNFINWFGDWINDPQNASKVVDENGEPLVVYHGSINDFNVYDINLSDDKLSIFTTDSLNIADSYINIEDVYGEPMPILPFVEQNENATEEDIYDALMRDEAEIKYFEELKRDIPKPKPLFNNIKKPFIIDAKHRGYDELFLPNYSGVYTTREVAKFAFDDGYDGVIIKNVKDSGSLKGVKFIKQELTDDLINFAETYGFDLEELKYKTDVESATIYISFNNNQIKSATDNVGTFSTTNNDIRYSLLEETENVNSSGKTIVSNMDRYLDNFSAKDKPLVARNLNDGYISFYCR